MSEVSWGADCGNDHYLVVSKVRKRLAVSKQSTEVSWTKI